jgi:membrane-anchored protein YejM (alkaline phosphatase superfamily)
MLRNRYRNAVYFEDALIGKIFHTLREQRLLDKSIVVITGDHGEEFFENGYFGHTSSFDDYQTKTVFVLHHPKTERHIVERITSHLDLVPNHGIAQVPPL